MVSGSFVFPILFKKNFSPGMNVGFNRSSTFIKKTFVIFIMICMVIAYFDVSQKVRITLCKALTSIQ